MSEVFARVLPEVHDKPVRMGRHIEHDPESWNYKEKTRLRSLFSFTRKPVVWPRYTPILDQGDLGSCTGNAITGLLGTAPFADLNVKPSYFDERFAIEVYSRATKVDNFPGAYPPEDTGSSGLAVAKVVKAMGFIRAYTWAFTTNGLISALSTGPVIVGVPWYQGFFNPDANNFVWPKGNTVGGHEFLIRGFQTGGPDGSGYFICDNSWGTSYGKMGSFYLTVKTWDLLRAQGADVTVPKK